ncbi:MAG: hypothetical protein AB7I42_25070 [Bradyrhizobium sp.]|uniref:hypothetical protein n=1 Tax=Bradyrhizobium sp. TaxID=376 RepID=UPI003D123A23
MSEWFHVGQKVVCVDDQGHHAPWRPVSTRGLDGLKRGRVYTVRAVGRYHMVACIWLVEIERAVDAEHPHLGEPGYAPIRFRPLREKKTDISVFKEMLVTPPKEVVGA